MAVNGLTQGPTSVGLFFAERKLHVRSRNRCWYTNQHFRQPACHVRRCRLCGSRRLGKDRRDHRWWQSWPHLCGCDASAHRQPRHAEIQGLFNEGQKTLQLGIDNKDPGQILLTEALNSDEDYSFKVEYQGGDIDYFQAKVMSFEKATAGVDSIRSATVQLELTTSKAGVGIVEVPAP